MSTGIEVTGPPPVMEARARLRALTPPRYRWWRHIALVCSPISPTRWNFNFAVPLFRLALPHALAR